MLSLNISILFVITAISRNFVRYNNEILLIKYAKPNQTAHFVHYNREFVITVIVITEFDCSSIVDKGFRESKRLRNTARDEQ